MKKAIILFGVFLSILLMISPTDVVNAELGDVYYGFEDDAVGDEDVGNSYVTIEGNYACEVDDSPTYQGDRSYKGLGGNTQFNATFNEGHRLVFFVAYFDNHNSAFQCKLKNSDNITIVKLKRESTQGIKLCDHEDTWTNMHSATAVRWYEIRVQLNASDEVFITITDHSTGNEYTHEDTPTNIDDNYNITDIGIESLASYVQHYDNIGYNDAVGDEGESTPDVDYAIVDQNNVEGITDVCLGETVKYDVEVVGDEDSRVCMYINNSDGETIFGACTLASTTDFYVSYKETGEYTFKVFDVYNDDGYSETTTFEVTECLGLNYTNTYGQFYVEFFNDGSECSYVKGDVVEVCYNIKDYTNYSTTDGRYEAVIYSTYLGNRIGQFTVYNDTTAYRDKLHSITLPAGHFYEIRVYNVTKTNGTYALDEVVYTSQPIEICYSDYTGDEEEEVGDTGLSDGEVKFFVGLGISLCITFIGFGIGTKLDGDNSELLIGMCFMVLGLSISAFFGLFPTWIPFTVGTIPVAYIVGTLYNKK